MEKASNKGYIQATHKLGAIYYEGKFGKIDEEINYEKAKEYFEIANVVGFVDSTVMLGKMNYLG